MLVDNLGLALALSKGRAYNYQLLRVCQQSAAICLASGVAPRIRWVPSELNPADGPSRGSLEPDSSWSGFKLNKEANGRPSGFEVNITENPAHLKSDPARDEESPCGEKAQSFKESEVSHLGREIFRTENIADAEEEGGGDRGLRLGVREHYGGTGVSKHQCGAEATIQELPRSLQAILQGSKPGMASGGGMGDRRDTLGLLRRLVPGRKEFSYRREDTGSGRVHVPAAQGQVDEGTEISKGVEEDRPTSQQASPSSSGSMWDSSNPFSQRTAEDGLEGDDRLRLLSSTRRRDGHTRKACREAVEKCRPTISTVLPSDQRSGRRCTRQDRHFRQHSSFRQPSDEELVGASIGEACSDIGKTSPIFDFKPDQFRVEFQKAGETLGLNSLHTYQLRHGGASDDLNSKLRDHHAVRERGRWRTDASVRRYAKSGKIQKLLQDLQKDKLDFCKWAARNMENMVTGKTPARIP